MPDENNYQEPDFLYDIIENTDDSGLINYWAEEDATNPLLDGDGIPVLDESLYEPLTITELEELDTIFNALWNGDTLLVRNYQKGTGGNLHGNMLVRIQKQKRSLTQISHQVEDISAYGRDWITFPVSMNDLELHRVFQFEEETFVYLNKYLPGDIVEYRYVNSEDVEHKDTAYVTEVWMAYNEDVDPPRFAYKLSNNDDLHEEQTLNPSLI